MLLRTVYGEALDPPGAPPTNPASASPAQHANLRGKPVYVFDCAGLVTSIACDFKGNLLSASRRLAVAYQTEPEWTPGENLSSPSDILNAIQTASPPRLQDETFTTETKYDALNRVIEATAPDASPTTPASITRPVYNEANLLNAVHVSVRGATETHVVTDLNYNARGQRIRCEYGNGTVTTYQYDPKTFRLTELLTLRGTTKLQHLLYSYDPVGNITDLQDLSNWDPVLTALTASGVTGSGKYRYDAVYRLLSATGREHPGPQPGGTSVTEPPLWSIPHGNDLQALQSYREELTYDAVGNILEMRHLRGTSNNASWSRRYDYFLESNRLRATSAPGDAIGTYSDPYGYLNNATNDAGAHGSMTSMPHLAALDWDYADRLKHTLKSNGSAQDTYFTYDASGQRVRKVYHHDGLIEERIYLGSYEVYRRHTSGAITTTPTEERQTLHVMDDQRRVAMAETKTRDAGAAISTPVTRWRFQLDNHLGSATLELDSAGNVISYEEYHPYGSTAFHTADGNYGVSAKRYRYTGKEKDEETGLYYHGARYYAPWLGRWTAADPIGLKDGPNLYGYSRDNPIRFFDPAGTQSHASFRAGTTDYDVGTSTDAQLLNRLRGMSAEQRAEFRDQTTGKFAARVNAFLSKFGLGVRYSVPETTVEGGAPPSRQAVEARTTDREKIEGALRDSGIQVPRTPPEAFPQYLVRKDTPIISEFASKAGLEAPGKVGSSSVTAVEHALGLHEVSGEKTPFISVSEKFPEGATGINGERIFINSDVAKQHGAEYISHDELMKQVASEHPDQPYLKQNPIHEREGLFVEKVPAAAIESTATVATRGVATGLGLVGVGLTSYNLTNAAIESVEQDTPVPLAKQVVREAGGWGGAWVGAKIGAAGGAALGIETGPGAILTGLGGALVFGTAGFLGARWALGDFD